MNRIRHLIRLCVLTAVLAASASLVASCSLVEENEENLIFPEEKDDSFQLRFQICTRTLGSSRAADIAGDEEGSGAENIINLKDIRYYIFDKDGNFLLDLTPDIDEDRSFAVSSDYTYYEIVAKIDPIKTDYFKKNKGGTVDFYLMAIANYSGYSYVNEDKYLNYLKENDQKENDYIKTLSDMFVSPYSPVINGLPDTAKLMNAASDTDAANKNYFPMAGLQHFSLSGTWFDTQAGEVPVDISYITGKNLNMLRSLAKIEIVDRINMPDDKVYNHATEQRKLRIESAAINGVTGKCRLIPAEGQWTRNNVFETQQVILPTVTSSEDYLIPPALVDGKINSGLANISNPYSLNFVYDSAATERRADKCRVFSCYVWEYSQSNGGIPISIDLTQCPYLTISTTEYLTANAAEPDRIKYYLPLSINEKTTDGTIETKHIPFLLRNHIYRYEVTGAGAYIEVDWTVCDMDKASADITFN